MAHEPTDAGQPLVLREDRDDVIVLTLIRPHKRNALSRDLIAALGDVLRRIAGEPQGRAIVLTASGTTFCSGMDLKEAAELLAMPEPEAGAAAVADMQAFADLLDQLHTFPRPIVAAVQGDALAGGAGIVMACDFVVMASTAVVGYPEVKRGIVASVVMHDLARLVGARRARQLLLTGEPIDAAQAQAWGLVNHVAAPDHCFHRAMQIATHLSHCAPQALATTKQLLDEATGRPASLRPAAAVSAALRASEEAREGIRAFVDKRHARWQISPARLPAYRS